MPQRKKATRGARHEAHRGVFGSHVRLNMGVRVRGGVSHLDGGPCGHPAGRNAARSRSRHVLPRHRRGDHAPHHAGRVQEQPDQAAWIQKVAAVVPRGLVRALGADPCGSSRVLPCVPAGLRPLDVAHAGHRAATGRGDRRSPGARGHAALGAGRAAAFRRAHGARAQHPHDVRRGMGMARLPRAEDGRQAAHCADTADHGRDLGPLACAAHRHRA